MRTNGMRGEWKENKVGKREECNQQRESLTKTTFSSVNSPVGDLADLTLRQPTDRTGVGNPQASTATPLYQPIHLSASILPSAFGLFPFFPPQLSRFCH